MMTCDEVARELRVSTKTIRNLVRDGRFPKPTRIGRGIRFFRDEVEAYLEQNRV